MAAMTRNRGFTLIELMVTLLVAAILAGIAVPNFSRLVESNRVTSATNELVASLSGARSEAVRRGRDVAICASDDGSDCGAGNGWRDGWILFGDTDGDGALDAGEEVLRVAEGFSDQLSLVGSEDMLRFRSNGLLRGTASPTFDVEPYGCETGQESRRVTVNAVGRVALERTQC